MPIHAKVSGTPIWQLSGTPEPTHKVSRDPAEPHRFPDTPAPRRQDERGSTMNPLERLRLAALQVSTPASPPIGPQPFRNRRDSPS